MPVKRSLRARRRVMLPQLADSAVTNQPAKSSQAGGRCSFKHPKRELMASIRRCRRRKPEV